MRLFLTMLLGFVLTVSACARSAPPPPLNADQELELRTLCGQLNDPNRSSATRIEAAMLLLSRPYPQAAETLTEFLKDATNPAAQIAVAEAIARQQAARKAFVDPLMAMLRGDDASARAAAAKALSVYKNDGVTEKLIALANNAKSDPAVRIVAISSLQQVLEKDAVAALIRLLDDRNANVRQAALDALAKLTNIRTFGSDTAKWKQWWRDNRNKDRDEWLASLAENWARENARLEAANAQLRDRLARTMNDLYTNTPAAQQDALLMGFLKDPLPDVRLVALAIVDRRSAAGEDIPPEFRTQVRSMVSDPEPAVRQAAAQALANFGDTKATNLLLARLKSEESPAVREAILSALGQMRAAEALPAVLASLNSKYENVSAAAAAALARIITQRPLTEDEHTMAVEALIKRYQAILTANGVAGRETVIMAMGAVKDPAFLPVLEGALKDKTAAVRQAAVNSLAQLGRPEAAEKIAPLTADADRGVRQAALRALGALDGTKHLDQILGRTNPAVESDSGVRQQAWDVAMRILAESSPQTLANVIASLASRPDARDQRIALMEMRLEMLQTRNDPDVWKASQELGIALQKAGRSVEAVPHFAAAYKILAEAKNPKATDAWRKWVSAMLAADDPGIVRALADQTDAAAFADGVAMLDKYLKNQVQRKNWANVITLSGEAVKQLATRLNEAQLAQLDRILVNAEASQQEADTTRVHTLVAQLTSADETARKSAVTELAALKSRAVKPLLRELREVVNSDAPNAALEAAILSVLQQIAPDLTGYDSNAEKTAKLNQIDAWLKQG